MDKGKLIVLYGINNLGKTTQARMLVDRLNLVGIKAEYIKYPIYALKPSGVMLNDYLRNGNPYGLSTREAQMLYTQNRTQFEEEITRKIEAGITIIAEDYTGTGIAWGIGAGVDEVFLKHINSHLLKEDLGILFDGERFINSVEQNHKHETNNELVNNVRSTHLRLARELNWLVINANDGRDVIHQKLWNLIYNLLIDTQQVTAPASDQSPAPAAPISFHTTLKIKRLDPTAKLPSRAHATDAGLDLYSVENRTIYPGELAKLKTGLASSIPVGYVGLIWDKSGLAARGLKTMGGVIDAGYRGEITIIVKNSGPHPLPIEQGQKIAQLLIQKIENVFIDEVSELDETERGQGGFGSSGRY